MAERAITHRSDKFAEPDADAAGVESGWRHAVALHESQVGLKRALEAAEQALAGGPERGRVGPDRRNPARSWRKD